VLTAVTPGTSPDEPRVRGCVPLTRCVVLVTR
jgi:hypothetical protein